MLKTIFHFTFWNHFLHSEPFYLPLVSLFPLYLKWWLRWCWWWWCPVTPLELQCTPWFRSVVVDGGAVRNTGSIELLWECVITCRWLSSTYPLKLFSLAQVKALKEYIDESFPSFCPIENILILTDEWILETNHNYASPLIGVQAITSESF